MESNIGEMMKDPNNDNDDIVNNDIQANSIKLSVSEVYYNFTIIYKQSRWTLFTEDELFYHRLHKLSNLQVWVQTYT